MYRLLYEMYFHCNIYNRICNLAIEDILEYGHVRILTLQLNRVTELTYLSMIVRVEYMHVL